MSSPDEPASAEPAATPAQRLEHARELGRQGRHADALPALDALLAAEPQHPGAHLQRAEALFALKRVGEATQSLEIALRQSPRHFRLHVLWGENRRAHGQFDEAEAAYATALGIDANRPLGWSRRIDLALARQQWMRAVTLLRDGLAATGDVGLWRGAVPVLQDAGAVAALAEALALQPVPAVNDTEKFLAWARLALRAGESVRVAAMLESALPSLPEAARAECHALLADIALAAGDLPRALAARRAAVDAAPTHRGLRRQWLRAMLSVGDVDGASAELASLASSRAPQDDLVDDVRCLQEAQRFREPLRALQQAFARGDATPASLAAVVRDAPGCLVAAVAFLAALRGASAAPTEAAANADHAVPACFWSLESAAGGWAARHPGGEWHALAYGAPPDAVAVDLKACQPVLRRLPDALHSTLLQATVLARRGGWWIPAERECHGALPEAAGRGTRLLLLCDGEGLLLADCIGCLPGDAVMTRLAVQLDALASGAAVPGDPAQLSPGRLLTLCAADVLASRVLAGGPVRDVRILGEATFRRAVA